jgi:hypothetical protein
MSSDSIRVFVPLTVRRRNGRPKILPPETAMEQDSLAQDPHILKALGRAWAWRRKLECGEATTIHDIATAEKVTGRFVSRIMRLAYLSPDVLERLLLRRKPSAVSINDLVDATYLPWPGQLGRVFDDRSRNVHTARMYITSPP